GVANFYKVGLAAESKMEQVTFYEGSDIHRPYRSADYKRAVFEQAGRLFWVELDKAGPEPQAIKLQVKSDVRNSGLETRTITGGGQHVHMSRDSRMLTFSLRGDIWLMPAGGGNGRRVTSGPSNDQWPRFSPDGTKIAYFSTKSGNNDIYLLDIKSGESKALT